MDRIYKGGIKAYWKRRGYYRLDAATAQRCPPLRTAELGGGAPATEGLRRRRRGWRVRRGVGRRLLRALSPRRWLARLRDAYVSAMLRLAPYCTAGPETFGRSRQLKEYDEKVLVEIYGSILERGGPLVVAGHGAPANAAAATLRLPMAA